MRMKQSVLAASLAVLAAVPCLAAIKAMTLTELMGITTEAAHVKITAKSTFHMDWPMQGAVWTKMHIQGESLRTLEPVDTDVVFMGSQDPADEWGMSEMPTLQDTRVGGEAVVFFNGNDKDVPGRLNRVYALDCVYRVEATFGTPVVIGKGEGFAFPENSKLDDVRATVRATHLELAKIQQAGK